jgi:hypothetical protein
MHFAFKPTETHGDPHISPELFTIECLTEDCLRHGIKYEVPTRDIPLTRSQQPLASSSTTPEK